MSSFIFNREGECVSQSHNLRAIMRGAGLYGGVTEVHISPVMRPTYRGMVKTGETQCGSIKVVYANGYTGKDIFVCYSHAQDWANEKSTRRGTWWTGCKVVINEQEAA